MPPTNLLKSNGVVVIPNNIHFGMVLPAIVKQITDNRDREAKPKKQCGVYSRYRREYIYTGCSDCNWALILKIASRHFTLQQIYTILVGLYFLSWHRYKNSCSTNTISHSLYVLWHAQKFWG